MVCLKNWVDMLIGVSHRSVLIVGDVKESVKRVLFECVHCVFSQRQISLDWFKQVTLPDAFSSSIFDKAAFCFGERQGMLVSDEHSSWYSRVSDFLL